MLLRLMSYTESARYTFSNRQSQPLAVMETFILPYINPRPDQSSARTLLVLVLPFIPAYLLCIRIRKSHSQVHIVDRPINADRGRGRSRGDVRGRNAKTYVCGRAPCLHFTPPCCLSGGALRQAPMIPRNNAYFT